MGISVAMPVGLIITEVVSNSLKYAFSGEENGEISLRLFGNNDDLHLIIKDNGCGFDDQQSSDDHLGVKLIHLLAKQIKATIASDPVEGLSYIISFKSSAHAYIDR